MKTKRLLLVVGVALVLAAPSRALAKLPPKIEKALNNNYTPAVPHRGLESAYVPPEPDLMRSYVVVLRGGIPAERARFFISWGDYDYRGVVIHAGEGDKMSTRRGAPYAYLEPGDVMAVTGIERFSKTIYLKLQSADVYVPENRQKEKHHSRVTVMLGFEFPKSVFKDDDAEDVLKVIGGWLKPFPGVGEAKDYAWSLKVSPSAGVAGGDQKKVKSGKSESVVEAAVAADTAAGDGKEVKIDDARFKTLEDKIEAAKRQMEEAEREMQKLKEGKSKAK